MATPFSGRAAGDPSERQEALQRVIDRLSSGDVKRVRFAWADLHGVTRCKTLPVDAAIEAMAQGLAFVSTPLLKDTSDRTAVPVFDADALSRMAELAPFAQAPNLVLLPDPRSFVELPWSPGTGWLLGDSFHADGSPCEADPRRLLARQTARLARAGYRMMCGLEVEFHVYRVTAGSPHLDPETAGWPGPAPRVEMLHAGYRLLSEGSADASHEVLELIESTAIGLGLPLLSLEVEFGPSQFEAVFGVLEAGAAADAMVLFRSAVQQVLARHGYWATFACRPPFPFVMSSGWHLHQSLIDATGRNVFAPPGSDADARADVEGDAVAVEGNLDSGGDGDVEADADPDADADADAERRRTGLSPIGTAWLAGLMAHALGGCVLATSTVNGYARFRPSALAPTRVRWGHDDRSALFRLVGEGAAARIENRLGEPAANPYLYMASQIIGGLDGLDNALSLASVEAALGDPSLPGSLGEALEAFAHAEVLRAQLGAPLCRVLDLTKASEWARHSAADDPAEFDRREYFGRF